MLRVAAKKRLSASDFRPTYAATTTCNAVGFSISDDFRSAFAFHLNLHSKVSAHSLLTASNEFQSLIRPSPQQRNTHHRYLFQNHPSLNINKNISARDVVLSFKTWFESSNNNKALLNQIFAILNTSNQEDDYTNSTSIDFALSQLGIRLSERFVLDVLSYGDSNSVLSCLKFFDWAGRQPGFYHSRATFNAIFKILSKAELMSLMLDFLESFTKHRNAHRVRFYDTLVMGYAVAGKLEVALQVFGKMRFQGLDLDGFGYHVLLNALVEESCFDVAEMVLKQIRMRGFEGEVTHSIVLKSLCRQSLLDDAEKYLREAVSEGNFVTGATVAVLLSALCKGNMFERACKVVEEFTESGVVQMEYAYHAWIRGLVELGKLDEALEFLQRKKLLEGYVPDVFRYNVLIWRLLKENRLEDVCDLFMEMKESQIFPDKVTMNAALCFFCKAGMVDVALELYNMGTELGLSPNSMTYNYLFNTLCGDGSTEEAYRILKNTINQGIFPGPKSFKVLADALCREGKLDMMKELLLVSLDQNIMPSNNIYENFISALCKASRIEDGFLMFGEIEKIDKVTRKSTYYDLIYGLNKVKRGDIAARVLVEMQKKGHLATRGLVRDVISCQCQMENPDMQFLKLLDIQLSFNKPSCKIYNLFIDGARHAQRPDLARKVLEMMQISGVKPNLNSDILMLQSYLQTRRVSDALSFFNDIRQKREIKRKLYNVMIVGLCRAKRADIALHFFDEMIGMDFIPSIECYEELVRLSFSNRKYNTVVQLINHLEKVERPMSSYLGNMLLYHALNSGELYKAWVNFRDIPNRISPTSLLDKIIAACSGHIKLGESIEDLEEVIEQCFPLDIATYNMLLKRLTMSRMDLACTMFNRICQKGCEPNGYTYDTLVQGFYKHGRMMEANWWLEEKYHKGFGGI